MCWDSALWSGRKYSDLKHLHEVDQPHYTLSTEESAAVYKQQVENVTNALQNEFRPEFINRLDDVIVFHHLNRENLKVIVDIELGKLRSRLRDRGMELVLTDEAKDYLIEKGYNSDYGARPLRRAIESLIEDPLSEDILRGTFEGMDTLDVTLVEDEAGKRLKFTSSSSKALAEEPVAVGGPSEEAVIA